MTEEQIALARRAVACKGWRWMDGMRALDGDGACGFRLTENSGLPGHPEPVVDDAWLPDLTDSATLGCLLALVREAWKGYRLWLEWNDEGQNYQLAWWREFDKGSHQHVWGVTEAEALVAALEAAP
jgi:hypothetical protein